MMYLSLSYCQVWWPKDHTRLTWCLSLVYNNQVNVVLGLTNGLFRLMSKFILFLSWPFLNALHFLNRINTNEIIFLNMNINLINNCTCIYTRHQSRIFLKALLVYIESTKHVLLQ